MLSATSSKLVAGSVSAESMTKPQTAKIRVTRAFFYKGVVQPVGKVIEYPEGLAVEAINLRKAERVVDAPEPKKAKDDK